MWIAAVRPQICVQAAGGFVPAPDAGTVPAVKRQGLWAACTHPSDILVQFVHGRHLLLSRMPQAGWLSHSLWLGVAFTGCLQHTVGGPDLGFRWLQDRVPLAFPPLPGWAFVLPVGVFVRDDHVLAC